MPECGVRFRLLGPVELVVRGRPVGLTGKQRTLLSLLLGLAPSGGLTTAVAATLADVPRRAARDLLDAIARVHLVHETVAHGFVCHDLLTEFAVERSAEEDGALDRHAAVMRLFEYYLRSVGNAARANGLHELSLPYEQVSTGVVAETFDSPRRP